MFLSMIIRKRAEIRNSLYPLSFLLSTIRFSVYLPRPLRAFVALHLDLHGSRVRLKITYSNIQWSDLYIERAKNSLAFKYSFSNASRQK